MHKRERSLKSSAHTKETLEGIHNIVVPEMAQTLKKELRGKFTSINSKSLKP